ncbi:unnamed protein product [Caenorhabditis angaria]|uniref:Uncharacterized protein n=1 Tax=Caenorhabditis angaria TaxID=860376 RepID=A0A9P1INU5_9PELO|nr:unnamed protein product [Caenorhabditis angaria]
MAKDKSKSKSKSVMSKQSGLSPPKESEMRPEKEMRKSKTEDVTTGDNDIDKTQWEYSRFKDESKGIITTDPDIIQRENEKVGESTPLLAEKRQIMLVRGEQLKKIPFVTIALLILEILITIAVMICWFSHLNQNETIPITICCANLIIAIIAILILLALEITRMHVKKEELNDQGDYRFRIPYEYKYWMCMGHLLRAFLTCANITIAALDDNFDNGVIVVIAVQPLLLILSLAHVFFAMRP